MPVIQTAQRSEMAADEVFLLIDSVKSFIQSEVPDKVFVVIFAAWESENGMDEGF